MQSGLRGSWGVAQGKCPGKGCVDVPGAGPLVEGCIDVHGAGSLVESCVDMPGAGTPVEGCVDVHGAGPRVGSEQKGTLPSTCARGWCAKPPSNSERVSS